MTVITTIAEFVKPCFVCLITLHRVDLRRAAERCSAVKKSGRSSISVEGLVDGSDIGRK